MAQQPATQSEVGQEAGGHAYFPPFAAQTFPSQLLWLAVTFGALYLLMARVALPKLGGLIETRKARIAKDLDDAAAMQQKADAAAAAHEKTIADARARAKLAAADEEIAATRAKAMSNVETIARDAAAAIFERILGRAAESDAVGAAVAAVKNG
jgi:F-type H+-transporting ATPase subunit b